MADASRGAGRGIEPPRAPGQQAQLRPQAPQLVEALVELGAAPLQQPVDVVAGRLAEIAKRDHPADLAQAEAADLCGTDEPQPAEDVGAVVPIAGLGAGRRGHQPKPLVIAKCLCRHARVAGRLPDAHPIEHTIDLDL
jgi:hypothetical protein